MHTRGSPSSRPKLLSLGSLPRWGPTRPGVNPCSTPAWRSLVMESLKEVWGRGPQSLGDRPLESSARLAIGPRLSLGSCSRRMFAPVPHMAAVARLLPLAAAAQPWPGFSTLCSRRLLWLWAVISSVGERLPARVSRNVSLEAAAATLFRGLPAGFVWADDRRWTHPIVWLVGSSLRPLCGSPRRALSDWNWTRWSRASCSLVMLSCLEAAQCGGNAALIAGSPPSLAPRAAAVATAPLNSSWVGLPPMLAVPRATRPEPRA